MFKKDSLSLGLLIGLVAPIIGFIIYRFTKFKLFSVSEMFGFMRQNPSQINAAIIISLLANLVLFTFFLNKKIDKTARGIFFVTCLYALVALAFKYLF